MQVHSAAKDTDNWKKRKKNPLSLDGDGRLLGEYSRQKELEQQKALEAQRKENTMTKTMEIKGMMCPHCEATVKKALEAVAGVTGAEVSHEKGTAVVSMDAEVANDVLKKAVEDKDYEVLGIA
jgi:Cu2+-exporting ATPase